MTIHRRQPPNDFMNCADCVHGVGDFWSGLGNFASSGFGQAIIGAGVSIGTAFALRELDLAPSPGNRGGTMAGGSTVNPAGSVYNPTAQAPAQPIILQTPPAATPAWVWPAAIGAGVLVLFLAMRK